MKQFLPIIVAILVVSCANTGKTPPPAMEHYASYFTLLDSAVVSISPYDGHADTLRICDPMDNIVCMSSSYIGFLSAIGRSDAVTGVSGMGYVSDSTVRVRGAHGLVRDVGYDAAPDYEGILTLHPDLVITYMVSSTPTPFMERLRSLGIPVLTVYEHLESHPLGRAEYMRLFGKLTGVLPVADSLFGEVCRRYDSLAVRAADPVPVLINIPYADQWYIPGEENYMSRLVRDAGGRLLGAERGSFTSSIISAEQAMVLSREARLWLHTGWCSTLDQLYAVNPAFRHFDIGRVYNNTLRTTPSGGNDFWESGPARPDVILGDLRKIMEGDEHATFHYYLKVE